MAKAAVTRSIRDDHQKNFLKIFNGLTGKHSRWEIWEDFVTLTAIEISNSTDKVNATERTKMYQTIISKYSAKERDGMAEMLAEVVMGMEQNPDQDFLGSLYMMCELGNDHAGQFFTPYDVCRCMAEITFDPKLHPDMEGFISVSDPACGAGATLLAFLNVCKRRNICYHNKVLVIAQDIDFIVGLMCYIQCSFMGCAGYVVIGDTLVNPATAYDSRGLLPAGPQNRIWYMPLFSTDVWYMRRQIAQMNLLFEPKGEPAKIEKTDIKPANLQKSIKNEQIREDTELEDALKMFNAYDTEPEKILLAVAFDATDSSREGYWSTEWNGPTGASKFVHRKNDDLDSTYELLAALGYEMADDEKALQDGTHQLFAVYGSGSQADTPCDKCKAAHPECDKCCKTCDDHCNAFQLCRKEYGE